MNQDLIENFVFLQDYYRVRGDRGRSIAYGKAIGALSSINTPITDARQVKGVYGIGPKITAKVKEYLDTGQIRAVEEKRQEMRQERVETSQAKAIREFSEIWGVGPVKAKALYAKGMRSIDQLGRHKNLLNKQQQIGLKYYDDLKEKVPRSKIVTLYTLMILFLDKKYGSSNYKIEIAGSYRRGKKESGDIDCLVSSKVFNLKDMVKLFRKKGLIVETLSMRKVKFMGIARCPSGGQSVRLDIEFVPEEEWGTALLYFTGSKRTNVYMRSLAKKKGYLLNEHGLFVTRTGRRARENATEEDVFEVLGLPYKPPEQR
jgi:DNA polymerase beta